MPMKTPRFVFVVMMLGGFSGCDRQAEGPPAAPPEVLVLPAMTRDVPVYRDWIGTLDGSDNAEIRARVTGYLTKRNYKEGAMVKKDDVLFEIDARPFEAALAEARSQLEQSKAMQLASQADFDRSKELFDKKVISVQEYTNKTQLNESNVAKVKALEAAVEQARLNVQFCKVLAPVDGIAGIAKAQVGDLVGSGSNVVLANVATLDPIKIVFPINESEYLTTAERIQGALARPLEERDEFIELILADGKTFAQKGRLLAVDLSVKSGTGTILVTALAGNPGSVLRPGFYARARVVAQTLKDAVVVPQRAVNEVQGSYQIGIVGQDGKAEIRPVKTGPRSGSDWVITDGLQAGEKVIVEGLQKVRAGVPVSAKPWAPPPALATPAPAAAVLTK